MDCDCGVGDYDVDALVEVVCCLEEVQLVGVV